MVVVPGSVWAGVSVAALGICTQVDADVGVVLEKDGFFVVVEAASVGVTAA